MSLKKIAVGVVLGAVIGLTAGLAAPIIGTGMLASIGAAVGVTGLMGAVVGGMIAVGGLALLQQVAKAFAKKPSMDLSGVLERLTTSINPQALAKFVFGKTAAGTDVIYADAVNNQYVTQIIEAAHHKIHSYGALYIDGELAISEAGVTQSKWVGILTRYTNLGTASQSALVIPNSLWPATARGRDVAHYALRWDMKAGKDELSGGIPSRITQEVNGAVTYDPRKDSTVGGSGSHRANDQSTWEYSANWALVVISYLIGYKSNGRLAFGYGVDPADIDYASFISAANICDETHDGKPRYRVGGVLALDNNHDNFFNQMESAIGAKISSAGGRWFVWVPHNDVTPIGAGITEGMLLRNEGVEFIPAADISELFNTCRGRYVDPTTQYQPVPYPDVIEDAAVIIDERDRETSHDFSIIQDVEIAERVARFILRRSRFTAAWRFAVGPEGLYYEPFDVTTLNCYETNFEDVNVRVIAMDYSASGAVVFSVLEEDASIYDDTLPLGTPITQLDPSSFNPAARYSVSGLAVTARSVPGDGPTAKDWLEISWDDPGGFVRDTEVQYRKDGSTVLQSGVPKKLDLTSVIVGPVEPDTDYEARARHISITNTTGAWSSWVGGHSSNTETVENASHVPWGGVTDPDGTRPEDNATRVVPAGTWDALEEYEKGDLVIDPDGTASYIAKQDVPPGTLLSNTVYWQLLISGTGGAAGANGVSGILSNQSHVVATEFDGSGGDYSDAGGQFSYYEGSINRTSLATFAKVGSGTWYSINGSGVYTISDPGADHATCQFDATYGGTTIRLTYSISKSRAGEDGTPAKTLRVLKDREIITYNSDGAIAPASQTTTFTAFKQNTTATVTWSAKTLAGDDITPVTDLLSASTGDSVTMTAADFDDHRGASLGVIVTGTISDGGTISDTVNVIRVQDGRRGASAFTLIQSASNLYDFSIPTEIRKVTGAASGYNSMWRTASPYTMGVRLEWTVGVLHNLVAGFESSPTITESNPQNGFDYAMGVTSAGALVRYVNGVTTTVLANGTVNSGDRIVVVYNGKIAFTVYNGTIVDTYTGLPDDAAYYVAGSIFSTASMLGVVAASEGRAGDDGTDGTDGADGEDAVNVELTLYSAQVFAYADGNVPSFSGIGGKLTVWRGDTDVTASAALSASGSGVTGSINSGGNYSVSAMSGNTGTLVLTAVYAGKTYIRNFSVSKVLTGYEIVASLPVSNLFNGRMVFLTSDGKLYRYTGSGWTAEVPASDVTGQLTNSQLESIAAAKVTGQIGGGQIADDSITADKINAIIGGGNLVSDSSFEASLTTPQWSLYNNGGVGGYVEFTAPAWFNSVSAAAVAGATPGSTLGVSRNNAVFGGWKANVWYVISWYAMRSSGGSMTTSGLRWNNSPNDLIALEQPTLISGTWQRYVFRARWTSNPVPVSGQLYISADGSWGTGHWIRIDAVQVEEGEIVTAFAPRVGDFLPGSVSAVTLANDSVTAPKIVAGAVVAGKLAADAVVAANIAAGAVVAGKLAADSVVAANIAANAVTAGKIAANAILAVNIAANAITADKINAGAVTAAKIGANEITAIHITSGAITTPKIAAGNITASHMAANSITAANGAIANLAVVSGKIADLAVDTIKIADNAVSVGYALSNPASVTLSSSGAWVSLGAITITAYGGRVFVMFTCNSVFPITSTSVIFRIRRGAGTVVYSSGNTIISQANLFQTFSISEIVAAGSHTYTVECQSNAGGASANRSMYVQELRK